jgi:ion channel-forming bestrophin family protein
MIAPCGPHVSRMIRFIGHSLALFFLFDVVVAVAYVGFGQRWVAMPNLPLSIGSGVIGVVLGFRNNNSYARWWEARTLWGSIENYSRCVGRQAVAFISGGDDPPEQERVRDARGRAVYYQIAFVNALRCQLRGQEPWPELSPFLASEEVDSLRRARNAAAEIQRRMTSLFQDCRRRGWLDDISLSLLDQSLTALGSAQADCERIKNTPMPKQYDYFLRLVVQAHCALLPFGMVANLGLLTPIGASLLGFIFLALEKIGRDLEHPFDNSVHDVALTSICRTIEIDLKQCLGETDLPVPIEQVRGVLW